MSTRWQSVARLALVFSVSAHVMGGCYLAHRQSVGEEPDAGIGARDDGGHDAAVDRPDSGAVDRLCEGEAVQVEAGTFFSCARCMSGAVFCWGATAFLTGEPTVTTEMGTEGIIGPTRIRLRPAADLALGGEHACVVATDGSAHCWGGNPAGVRGTGTTEAPARFEVPTEVPGVSDVIQISASPFHTCALGRNGSVVCWGSNINGELGREVVAGAPFEERTGLAPALVAGISNATRVVTGGNHSCALLATGRVWCWGDNRRGTLGAGTWTASEPPQFMSDRPLEVRELRDVIDLVAGGIFTCALRSDGTVHCWGNDLTAERVVGPGGDLEGPFNTLPTPVAGLSSVTALSASNENVCAIASGRIVCWGNNAFGGNGNGAHVGWQPSPSAVDLPSAYQLGSGPVAGSLCALLEDRTVWCWGSNRFAQVGLPPAPYVALPLQVQPR